MSNNKKQAGSTLTNPQVLAAIITSVVVITAAIIGFLPTMLENMQSDTPTADNTPVIFVATATETLLPTDTHQTSD